MIGLSLIAALLSAIIITELVLVWTNKNQLIADFVVFSFSNFHFIGYITNFIITLMVKTTWFIFLLDGPSQNWHIFSYY